MKVRCITATYWQGRLWEPGMVAEVAENAPGFAPQHWESDSPLVFPVEQPEAEKRKCAHESCNNLPKRGSAFCRHHQPDEDGEDQG